MEVYALPASVSVIVISYFGSVRPCAVAGTLLASAHNVVAVITDHKPAENVIMLFTIFDIDLEKSLNIVKEITVSDSRAIFAIIPEYPDIFCVCKHIFKLA